MYQLQSFIPPSRSSSVLFALLYASPKSIVRAEWALLSRVARQLEQVGLDKEEVMFRYSAKADLDGY
jgi:hypothetical protein